MSRVCSDLFLCWNSLLHIEVSACWPGPEKASAGGGGSPSGSASGGFYGKSSGTCQADLLVAQGARHSLLDQCAP